jgi:hypothetical protein
MARILRSVDEHQQHPKATPDNVPRDDLEDNPGIGTTRGAIAGKGNST